MAWVTTWFPGRRRDRRTAVRVSAGRTSRLGWGARFGADPGTVGTITRRLGCTGQRMCQALERRGQLSGRRSSNATEHHDRRKSGCSRHQRTSTPASPRNYRGRPPIECSARFGQSRQLALPTWNSQGNSEGCQAHLVQVGGVGRDDPRDHIAEPGIELVGLDWVHNFISVGTDPGVTPRRRTPGG